MVSLGDGISILKTVLFKVKDIVSAYTSTPGAIKELQDRCEAVLNHALKFERTAISASREDIAGLLAFVRTCEALITKVQNRLWSGKGAPIAKVWQTLTIEGILGDINKLCEAVEYWMRDLDTSIRLASLEAACNSLGEMRRMNEILRSIELSSALDYHRLEAISNPIARAFWAKYAGSVRLLLCHSLSLVSNAPLLIVRLFFLLRRAAR